MEHLMPHTCHRCGATAEANFVHAGPHIKQVCLKCGFYVKFISKGLIPDIKTVKMRIWSIVEGELEIIDLAKGEIGFILEGLDALDQKLMYWQLYLKIRSYELLDK
jgi:hypothetical protein